MITLHLSAIHKDQAEKDLAVLKADLNHLRRQERRYQHIDVLGPTRSPIEKIRGRYRWQILLKGREIGPLHDLARAVAGLEKQGTLRIVPDVDPLNFM